MKNTFLFLLIFFFSISCQSRQKKSTASIPSIEEHLLVLIFAGDVMHHLPQATAAYNSKSGEYDYTPCFRFIKPYIETADISFCNFEFPLAGKPFSGFPAFSGPNEMLDALSWTGFDVIQTANNHVMDKGRVGHERTISQIEKRKLQFVGSYVSKEQKDSVYPLIINRKGMKLAVLAYTYSVNKLIKRPNYVNLLDSTSVIRDMQKAKSQSADFIIVTVHWGDEYQLTSNKYQQKWADFFVQNGADLIIGSHPHVVQNAEIKDFNSKKVPVFYSLGNLISNQRERDKNGGILARIEINTSSKTIQDVSYIPFYVFKGSLENQYQYYLLLTDEYVSYPSLYKIPSKDSIELLLFHQQTKSTLQNTFSYLDKTNEQHTSNH